MSSASEAMLRQEVEEANRAGRMVERQMRKFLAGALCAQCGVPLGDTDQIVQDDDERTVHTKCLTDYEE